MTLIGKVLNAMIGEKNISAIRIGMFAGQAYDLLREFQLSGKLPQGVKFMIDPEMLMSLIENKIKLNPRQRATLLETVKRFNIEVNKKADQYGKKTTAHRKSRA